MPRMPLRVPVSRLLGLLLLASLLSSLLGCVTSGPRPDPELDRKRARSHFNIAKDHVENGRIELALRELLTAERLDPADATIQHSLGIAYLQKGKPEEAEQHMRRALELQPSYQAARYNLSTLYLHQGRYEESIKHSQVLFDDPTFPTPWRALANWGWAALQLGRTDEARRHLEYAYDYNPHYWPTLLNLGILEAQQGNMDEAIRRFAAVLELDPGPSATAEANYRLAEIYVTRGERDKAVGHLRTAVVRAPGDPWGKKSEEYLRLLR